MQKTILVIGATGYLGGKVVRHLLDKNVKIKAFVRPTTDSGELKKLGIEICNGDLTKPETIEKALQGVDVVISSAIGYSNRKKGDSLKSVDDIGNKNLIDTLKKAKIQRFVFTSILTADKAKSVPHFWQKKLIEDYMDKMKVPYIALRPGAFLDQDPKTDVYAKGLHKGHLKVLGSTSIKWTNILTEDLANYLAIAATDDTIPLGKIDIGINEPMNAEMLAKFASEYTGKQIKTSAIPWAIIGTVFSVVGIFKPAMSDLKKMFNYFFTGQYIADTSLQQKYFGNVPTVKDSVIRYCKQINLQ
jgi:uncharacterized protein YbjT (DUF2867 family)